MHRGRRLGHGAQLHRLRPALVRRLVHDVRRVERQVWGATWSIIERHGVTILYTAPTAIRAFIRAGDAWPAKYDLTSLRLLGSVGEPINPEAWTWYHRVVGGDRCPIVDTWWQTETGSIMLTTLPGAVFSKPGATGLPFFGVDIAVVKDGGEPCDANEGGKLVIRKPWPSMARTLWNDDERYVKTYWDVMPNVYFTGDGARCDEDGYFWVVGRIDDVLNVAGHRIGTAEIERSWSSGRRRSRRRRSPRRSQRAGARRLRHAEVGAGRRQRPEDEAHGAHRQRDRKVRAPRSDPLHRRAPEDAERKNHEAPLEGGRERRDRVEGRYFDPRRPERTREVARARRRLTDASPVAEGATVLS